MNDFLGHEIFIGDIVIQFPRKYLGLVFKLEPELIVRCYDLRDGKVVFFHVKKSPKNIVVISPEMLNENNPIHQHILEII